MRITPTKVLVNGVDEVLGTHMHGRALNNGRSVPLTRTSKNGVVAFVARPVKTST
jgi:hypothetical protein